MGAMQAKKPRALLFDLGGVVIDIDFDRAFRLWQRRSRLSLEEMRARFHFDLQFQRHERGDIAVSEYYDHLACLLQIDADRQHIAHGWNSIFVAEIAETTALVQALRGHLPCFALTNTNAAHMATWSSMFPDVVTSFERIFASHQMGFRKPDRRAFDYVSEATGFAASSMAFFDDLLENVEAAAAAGIHGVHVRSPADVRDALRSFGCL